MWKWIQEPAIWPVWLTPEKISNSDYPANISTVLTDKILLDFKNSHQVKPAILTKPSTHRLIIPFWAHVKSPDKQAALLRKANPEKMHYNKEGEGAKLWNDRAVFLKLSLSKQLRTVTFIFLHNWSTLKIQTNVPANLKNSYLRIFSPFFCNFF